MGPDVMLVLRKTEALALPLEKAARLQFKCLTVSKEFIIFGTSAGSIYIFDRKSLELLKFVGSKVTALNQILLSPDGKGLAVSDSDGIVSCFEVDVEHCLLKFVREMIDHRGSVVTTMCWDEHSGRIFIGDTRGKVTSNIIFPLKLSAGKFLSKPTSESILKEEKAIVQLDFCNERLLVSTFTRTLLCLTEKCQFLQVGSKLRDGLYGSCFLRLGDSTNTVIYSARPGSRLWEVDSTGQVLATHQFKRSLAKPPLEIAGLRSELPPSVSSWSLPQSVNFPKLLSFKNRYLVTWSKYGLYIIDPTYGKAADWYDQVKDVSDVICHGNTIFILHTNGRTTELVYTGIKECLSELNRSELWEDFCKVSLRHGKAILKDPESFIGFDFQEISSKLEGGSTLNGQTLGEFRKLGVDLEEKHNVIRAAILERMNRLPDALATPSDSGVEDNDEQRSVGAASETSSSRLSLSRLAEIDVDNMVQKAKSALVTRIVNSGFIQKALKDALDAEEKKLETNSSDINDIGRLDSVSESTVRTAISDVAAKPEPVIGIPARKTSRQRRRRKPKTVDFGHGDDAESNSQLTRRSQSLNHLNAVPERDNVKSSYSSPPSPSQGQLGTHRNKQKGTDERKENSESEHGRVSPRCSDVGIPKSMRVLYQPNVDALNLISELVDVTASSRNKLRDTRFLFNPTTSRSILQEWVDKFDEVMEKYITSCISSSSLAKDYPSLPQINQDAFQMQVREDFFRRLGVAFSEISNLAMLCFESSILPSSCRTLSFLEKKLLNRSFTVEDCRYIVTRMSEIFALNKKLLGQRRSLDPQIGRHDELSSGDAEESKDLNNEGRTVTAEEPEKERMDEFVKQTVEKPEKVEGSGKETMEEPGKETVEKPGNETVAESGNKTFEKPVNDQAKGVNLVNSAVQTEADAFKTFEDRAKILSRTGASTDETAGAGNDSAAAPRRERESYFCLSGNMQECEKCREDACYACFVFRYFPLLDANRVRKIISWTRNCRWRMWLAYFTRTEESAESDMLLKAIRNEDWGKVSRILLELSSPDLLLAVVEELFDAQPDLVRECFRSGLLSPWEINFISVLILDGYGYDETVLSYLRKKSNESAYQDKQILVPLLKYTIDTHNLVSDAVCDCGKARPGAHQLKFNSEEELKKLIKTVIKKHGQDASFVKRLGNICKNGGYWKGALELLAAASETSQVLESCQQLGDSEFLDHLITKGLLRIDEKQWMHLILATLANDDPKSTSHEHHNCQPINEGFVCTWTTERLLWVMLRCIGPSKSLEILRQLPESRARIFDAFYFACMQTTMVEETKRNIVNKIREYSSADARSRGQWYMSAKLEAVKNKELRESVSTNDVDSVDYSGMVFSNSSIGRNQGQWGIGVVLFGAICGVCTLPLTTQAGFSSAGIIIFECGHCFHRKCVPEESCLTCFRAELKTVAPIE